jgi:predicted Fe-Mo cluster-binding NifX family protein
MKIIVTSEGNDLSAPTSPRFGRCPFYILVETETMAFQALPNPAMSTSGGAGIQAAQFVVEQGAEAVLTGNVGPNAMDVLQAADLTVYLLDGGSVKEMVEAYQSGRLEVAQEANVQAHAGMRRQRGPVTPPQTDVREQEIAALRRKATELRQELANIITRIEKLEKEC